MSTTEIPEDKRTAPLLGLGLGEGLGPTPQVAAREVSHAAFELCEFIEDIADKPTDSQEVKRFKAGQRYAAKWIRNGLGIWLTDEENRRLGA